MHAYVCLYVYMYVYTHVCVMYVQYICMYVHFYVCIHTCVLKYLNDGTSIAENLKECLINYISRRYLRYIYIFIFIFFHFHLFIFLFHDDLSTL